ncbi:hypothetical protein L596_030862 [Steinernema carpocapsae]|uniref:7TM GPCR serpentine receptor class x (Srx) domain-containing protein n=1 Tax=Steinernema carpocapsae TaxID=34508 RepID=A0A4U5LNC9_STECR|nr:hypothetical protein L596_030862 [Steinernema carpocapsae]
MLLFTFWAAPMSFIRLEDCDFYYNQASALWTYSNKTAFNLSFIFDLPFGICMLAVTFSFDTATFFELRNIGKSVLKTMVVANLCSVHDDACQFHPVFVLLSSSSLAYIYFDHPLLGRSTCYRCIAYYCSQRRSSNSGHASL